MLTPTHTPGAEKLFRSPWFWCAVIFVACQCSSFVQGAGFTLHPKALGLMIAYAFVFLIRLPVYFGGPSISDSGMVHVGIIAVGVVVYITFAFVARWMPRRSLYWGSWLMLGCVLCLTAGCTAWVLSWHR